MTWRTKQKKLGQMPQLPLEVMQQSWQTSAMRLRGRQLSP